MTKAQTILERIKGEMKLIQDQLREARKQEIKSQLYQEYKVKSLAARRIEDHINY